MKAIVTTLATGLGLLAVSAVSAWAGPQDDDVLAEMNFARTQPQAYARELRDASYDRDRGRGDPGFGYEDPYALDEAIDFLERQAPLPPLRADRRLAAAARAHTAVQSVRGDVGHGAQGGLGRRLNRQGVYAGLSAENISYGYASPRDVVRQLIVDSGVAGRGHRNNIFGRAFQVAGVACGRHPIFGSMCVIDFAGAVMERGADDR